MGLREVTDQETLSSLKKITEFTYWDIKQKEGLDDSLLENPIVKLFTNKNFVLRNNFGDDPKVILIGDQHFCWDNEYVTILKVLMRNKFLTPKGLVLFEGSQGVLDYTREVEFLKDRAYIPCGVEEDYRPLCPEIYIARIFPHLRRYGILSEFLDDSEMDRANYRELERRGDRIEKERVFLQRNLNNKEKLIQRVLSCEGKIVYFLGVKDQITDIQTSALEEEGISYFQFFPSGFKPATEPLRRAYPYHGLYCYFPPGVEALLEDQGLLLLYSHEGNHYFFGSTKQEISNLEDVKVIPYNLLEIPEEDLRYCVERFIPKEALEGIKRKREELKDFLV